MSDVAAMLDAYPGTRPAIDADALSGTIGSVLVELGPGILRQDSDDDTVGG